MVRAAVVNDGDYGYASQYEAIRDDYARRAQIPAKYVIVKEGTTFYADHCDGTGLDFDNTTLDALLTEVFSTGFTAGRTYKEKIVIKGEHTGLEQIAIPSYTIFEVQGLLQAKAALNDNFIENSDIVGGNEFIEILGGTIDANGANQTDDTNTIHFENVDFSSIHHSILKGGMRNTTDGETVELATCTFCGVHNIHGFLAANSYDHIKLTGTSTDCLISNNILDGSGGPAVGTRSGAIQAATGCDRNSIVGNLITTAFGGVKLHSADDNLVEANKIYGLTGSEAGIDLIATSSRNHIIGNKVNGIRTLSGIRVKQTAGGERLDDNIIESNTIYNYNVAGARGIDILSGGRRTRLNRNTVIGNAGGTDVGIIIGNTQVDDTMLSLNDLSDSNVNTKVTDTGTGTVVVDKAESITLMATATNAVWTNMPAALTELGGIARHRTRYDLSRCLQARLCVRIANPAGFAGSELRAQYATDDATWFYMDGGTGPNLAFDTAINTTVAGSWVWLTTAAIADVYLRVIGIDGDGIVDPAYNAVIIQVR